MYEAQNFVWVILAAHFLKPCKHVTQWFKHWWATKHETLFEDNREHLVSNIIPPPSQPKLLKNWGSNLGGKQILLVEAMALILEREEKEHKDESDSNKSDRYWKKPSKKVKVSDDGSCGRDLSAMGISNFPTPLVLIFSFSFIFFIIHLFCE